jgi:hypothetical protein
LTGISITRTGISNKNPTGTGILQNFQVGNGIGTPPPSGPSMKFAKIQYFLFLGEFSFYLQKLERKAHLLTHYLYTVYEKINKVKNKQF